jgi:Domain of unknown function (DUF4365)
MPTVSDKWLKGNYGAAVVMARLSGECLVRPVAADTDVGVDLYCETVVEGQPYLHFWVQVKTGAQCKLDPATATASCWFDREHLKYWFRQPVPVYAALVPTDWPVRAEPDIYLIDITTYMLIAGLQGISPSGGTLHSDYHWPAGAPDQVRAFLTEVVPETTARLQCARGVVTHSPTLTPQYVQKYPPVPVSRFKGEILKQLRTTAAFSVLFSAKSGDSTAEDKEFRHLLARIVEQFGDDPHWENFMSRACASHDGGDYGQAVTLYDKAKQGIEGDPNLPSRPDWPEWEANIKTIQVLQEGASRQEPFIWPV